MPPDSDDDNPLDALAGLAGAPVDPSPSHQGKTKAQYLAEGPGERTNLDLQTAGLRARMLRRWLAIAAVVAVAGFVALLLLM